MQAKGPQGLGFRVSGFRIRGLRVSKGSGCNAGF